MEANVFEALPDMVDLDLENMSELGSYHRRAYSDYSLHLNDSFDNFLLDQPNFDFITNDFSFPPPPPLTTAEMAVGSTEPKLSSLSVESDQLEGIGAVVAGAGAREGRSDGRRKRVQHRHSISVDVSSSVTSNAGKKTMTAEKLRELASVDSHRAKRILANRQSAARSKAKKMRYTMELEMRVKTLKMESATITEQVSMLKKDTEYMTARNQELKNRIEAMKQESERRKALNESLKEEVKSLKIQTAQLAIVIRKLSVSGPSSQLSLHQLQIQVPKNPPSQYQIGVPQQPAQLHMLPPPPLPGLRLSDPSFSNFKQLN